MNYSQNVATQNHLAKFFYTYSFNATDNKIICNRTFANACYET